MSNAPQTQNQQPKNSPSFSQDNKTDASKDKVDQNAGKNTGGMKDEACSTSGKPSKSSNA